MFVSIFVFVLVHLWMELYCLGLYSMYFVLYVLYVLYALYVLYYGTLMVEKIAPREVSSANKYVKTKKRPDMGSVKSDFHETLHAQSYMPKKDLTKPEGQE